MKTISELRKPWTYLLIYFPLKDYSLKFCLADFWLPLRLKTAIYGESAIYFDRGFQKRSTLYNKQQLQSLWTCHESPQCL